MIKKINLLIMTMAIVLCNCACGERKENELDLADVEVETIVFEDTDTLSQTIALELCEIEIPQNARVNSFCIQEDEVCYSIDYTDYFESALNNGIVYDFEEKYNTQIRLFHKKTKKDVLIYQYDEERCVQITDLQYNGEVLVWEDYLSDTPNAGVWNVMKIIPQKENAPTKILTRNPDSSGLTSITLTLKDNSLLWFDCMEDAKYGLYQYSIENQNTELFQEELSLASPYEHINVVNGNCVTYESNQESSRIHIMDMDKGTKRSIYIGEEISSPICNGKICIWMNGYEADDRNELYVLNLENGYLGKIETGYSFSYGIVGDIVLVNQGNGLYAYDVANGKKEALMVSKEPTLECMYTFQGNDATLYAEKMNEREKFVVVHLYEK